MPDPNKPYLVITNASGDGLGGVMMQDGKVVSSESKKLQNAEKINPTHDLELLRIVHALKI